MSSSVPFDNVVAAFRSLQSSAKLTISVTGNTLTVYKNGVPECLDFPSGNVSQRMLHRLQAKYGIRIEFFYRPELINASSNKTQ